MFRDPAGILFTLFPMVVRGNCPDTGDICSTLLYHVCPKCESYVKWQMEEQEQSLSASFCSCRVHMNYQQMSFPSLCLYSHYVQKWRSYVAFHNYLPEDSLWAIHWLRSDLRLQFIHSWWPPTSSKLYWIDFCRHLKWYYYKYGL